MGFTTPSRSDANNRTSSPSAGENDASSSSGDDAPASTDAAGGSGATGTAGAASRPSANAWMRASASAIMGLCCSKACFNDGSLPEPCANFCDTRSPYTNDQFAGRHVSNHSRFFAATSSRIRSIAGAASAGGLAPSSAAIAAATTRTPSSFRCIPSSVSRAASGPRPDNAFTRSTNTAPRCRAMPRTASAYAATSPFRRSRFGASISSGRSKGIGDTNTSRRVRNVNWSSNRWYAATNSGSRPVPSNASTCPNCATTTVAPARSNCGVHAPKFRSRHCSYTVSASQPIQRKRGFLSAHATAINASRSPDFWCRTVFSCPTNATVSPSPKPNVPPSNGPGGHDGCASPNRPNTSASGAIAGRATSSTVMFRNEISALHPPWICKAINPDASTVALVSIHTAVRVPFNRSTICGPIASTSYRFQSPAFSMRAMRFVSACAMKRFRRDSSYKLPEYPAPMSAWKPDISLGGVWMRFDRNWTPPLTKPSVPTRRYSKRSTKFV